MTDKMKKIRGALAERLPCQTQKFAAKNLGEVYRKAQESPVAITFHGVPDMLVIRVSGCKIEFLRRLFRLLEVPFPAIDVNPSPVSVSLVPVENGAKPKARPAVPSPKRSERKERKSELTQQNELWAFDPNNLE